LSVAVPYLSPSPNPVILSEVEGPAVAFAVAVAVAFAVAFLVVIPQGSVVVLVLLRTAKTKRVPHPSRFSAKGGMYKFNRPISIGYEIHPPRKARPQLCELAQRNRPEFTRKGTPSAKAERKGHKVKRKDRHGTLCALSETLASSAFIFHNLFTRR
jgi:hypothetical protein